MLGVVALTTTDELVWPVAVGPAVSVELAETEKLLLALAVVVALPVTGAECV